MAIYFQLFRKTKEGVSTEPEKLIALDVEICSRYGEIPHATRFYLGWYDAIGFWLANGDSWERIRNERLADGENWPQEAKDIQARLRDIATWMETTFEVRHWNGY